MHFLQAFWYWPSVNIKKKVKQGFFITQEIILTFIIIINIMSSHLVIIKKI